MYPCRNNRDILFTIELPNQEIKRFTNNRSLINFQDNFYFPSSGLEIQEIKMSGTKQEVVISGLFQEEGIKKEYLINNLKIQIDFIETINNKKIYKHFLVCFLDKILIENNKFFITCVSCFSKMNSMLTKCYSSTCRADLGDINCRVNLNYFHDYCNDEQGALKNWEGKLELDKSKSIPLSKHKVVRIISNNEILISNCKKSAQFYKGGYAFFLQCSNEMYSKASKDPFYFTKFKFLILQHSVISDRDRYGSLHYIKIKNNAEIPPYNINKKFVFLLKSCSKTHQDCNQLFKNFANFQSIDARDAGYTRVSIDT